MGRLPRPGFDRAFVHAFTRGNNRATVYLDEFDYVTWLKLLDRTVKRFAWRCHAYCLMPNHYHLLLETSIQRLSAGMRLLNGAFAQRMNLRYERTGHLFERPYGLEVVDSDAYLLELCRYIPLNPVRAGLTGQAGEWRWSSYRATAGIEHSPPYLTVSFVRSLFGPRATARLRYQEFVSQGAASRADMSADLVPGRGRSGR